MLTYHDIVNRLSAHYPLGEARAMVRLIAERRFSLSWTEVLCGGLDSLDAEQERIFDGFIEHLEQGEPVQYVLGEAEFYGRWFGVDQSTLIPRPETECLCDEINKIDAPSLNALDVGTGSGCIAITTALEHLGWNVEGWDISEGALAMAQKNATSLGARNVSFAKVDILDNPPVDKTFSLIVSNPPYICNKERVDMHTNVLDYEPSQALFVPDDKPLLFYEAITLFAVKTLEKGGRLLFEINREYGQEVAELLKNNGFTDVFVKKDQFDNDRIVGGIKI